MTRTAIVVMILGVSAASAQYLDPNVARGIDQDAHAQILRAQYLRKALTMDQKHTRCIDAQNQRQDPNPYACEAYKIEASALRAKAAAVRVPAATGDSAPRSNRSLRVSESRIEEAIGIISKISSGAPR